MKPTGEGDFTDRVVLVTGAGGGLGAAVAHALGVRGATVVLLGRRVPALEALYDRILADGGAQPAIYPLNLEGATPKDYADLADAVADRLGRLDALVHLAATAQAPCPIVDHDPLAWQRVLHVNLTAPFLLSQACLELLRRAPDGRLLFTTHRLDKAYWGAYAVSKAGLERLAAVLADELDVAPRVAVNVIEPGPVASPMMQRLFPGMAPEELRPVEEAVRGVLWALGPEAAGLSGRLIPALAPQDHRPL
ncbi:MAG: YciK family oxidoreductase [Gammaproteobacteria bacterium]|nr:MAG: YciK family oxidoreductase [Gammaproteobacteria bacterium]